MLRALRVNAAFAYDDCRRDAIVYRNCSQLVNGRQIGRGRRRRNNDKYQIEIGKRWSYKTVLPRKNSLYCVFALLSDSDRNIVADLQKVSVVTESAPRAAGNNPALGVNEKQSAYSSDYFAGCLCHPKYPLAFLTVLCYIIILFRTAFKFFFENY